MKACEQASITGLRGFLPSGTLHISDLTFYSQARLLWDPQAGRWTLSPWPYRCNIIYIPLFEGAKLLLFASFLLLCQLYLKFQHLSVCQVHIESKCPLRVM